MIKLYHAAVALLLSVIVLGCASAPAAQNGTQYDRTRIASEEIRAANVRTAFELVEQLRPRWLRARGQDSFGQSSEVRVYVNNQPTGGVGVLRQIAVNDLREVQFLDAIAATQRFGTGHGAGVIIVITR